MSRLRRALRSAPVLLLAAVGAVAVAQPSAPVAPSAWRPEVVSPPGVDAKGDLNLSIPVMTVPGNGGMSFPIRLSYSSAVPATQNEPSEQGQGWIGLGWRFNVGSVTREVFGGEVHDKASDTWTVQYVDDVASTPSFQPDRYSVTIPSGSATLSPATQELTRTGWDFEAVRVSCADSSCPSPYEPYTTTGNGGQPLPTQIVYGDYSQPDQVKGEYQQFVATTPDGMRHVFGKLEMATLDITTGIYENTDTSAPVGRQFYVRAWRLTEILGPNAIILPSVPLEGAPSQNYASPAALTDRDGEWIRILYGGETTHRPDPNLYGAGPASITERFWATRIVTPTHCAVFNVTGSGATLQSVALVQRDEASYDPSLPGWDSCSGTTLETVQINGGNLVRTGSDGTSVQLHQFGYTALGSSPTVGDFGYADDTPLLTSWRTATGGTVTVAYEKDRIKSGHPGLSYTRYVVGWSQYTPTASTRQVDLFARTYTPVTSSVYGPFGRRVRSITSDDGAGTVTTTTYTYGDGVVSAIPQAYHRRDVNKPSGYEYIFMPSNRLQAEIYYTWVRAATPGAGMTTTSYTTALSGPNGGVGAHWPSTVQWAFNHGFTGGTSVAQGGSLSAWGRAYRTEHQAGSGGSPRCTVQLTKRTFQGAASGGGTIWPSYRDNDNQDLAAIANNGESSGRVLYEVVERNPTCD